MRFIFIFENGKNSFSCGPPFGLFWLVKYFNFGQKLPMWTAHPKNPYCFVLKGEPKKAHAVIPMCRGAYIHYFKINLPIFCCRLFSENYLNPQVRINKMVNKHTVNYHPSPSQLISRINPLIFLWTPNGFISQESFLRGLWSCKNYQN